MNKYVKTDATEDNAVAAGTQAGNYDLTNKADSHISFWNGGDDEVYVKIYPDAATHTSEGDASATDFDFVFNADSGQQVTIESSNFEKLYQRNAIGYVSYFYKSGATAGMQFTWV